MTKLMTLVLALSAFGISSTVLANGYSEDGSWQFKSSASKYYMLQMRLAEELLKNGGPGPGNTTITVEDGGQAVFGDSVLGDKQQANTSNCVNCSTQSTDIRVGDSFSGSMGVGTDLTQGASNSKQTNGTIVENQSGGTIQTNIGKQDNTIPGGL